MKKKNEDISILLYRSTELGTCNNSLLALNKRRGGGEEVPIMSVKSASSLLRTVMTTQST